jgi:fibronectin-binding autotransporter adhesin
MKKLCQLAYLSAFLLSFNASACTLVLYFWDADGANPGPGSPAPTGTWGADPYWSPDDHAGNGGVQPTVSWPAGQIAVFSAGTAATGEATGDYTIFVKGTQQVADIHVDQGTVTFQPDPTSGGALDLISINTSENCTDRNNRLLSVGQKSPSTVATYNVVLTGANGIIRYKRGTLIFGVTNTYTGSTTIEGGVLQLGASYVIPTSSMLVLANDDGRDDVGWMGSTRNTPATFATGGFDQKLGPLKLSGPASSVARTINFGDGASALAFDDSSAQLWLSEEGTPIPLHIVNYTPGVDTLRFGNSASGLTKAQLALLRFADFADLPGKIDANGFVTPALPVIQSVRRAGP